MCFRRKVIYRRIPKAPTAKTCKTIKRLCLFYYSATWKGKLQAFSAFSAASASPDHEMFAQPLQGRQERSLEGQASDLLWLLDSASLQYYTLPEIWKKTTRSSIRGFLNHLNIFPFCYWRWTNQIPRKTKIKGHRVCHWTASFVYDLFSDSPSRLAPVLSPFFSIMKKEMLRDYFSFKLEIQSYSFSSISL